LPICGDQQQSISAGLRQQQAIKGVAMRGKQMGPGRGSVNMHEAKTHLSRLVECLMGA
jgi:hypothetical protein